MKRKDLLITLIHSDLRHTDCLNKALGLQSIPSNSVDMIFADLPYGITNAKWDSIIPMKPLFKQYQRIIKDHGAILLFGTGLFTSKLNLVGNQYVPYRYNWIWEKSRGTNQINCHKMPMNAYEMISVFYKHLPTYSPQMRIGSWHNVHNARKSLKGSIFASGDLKHLGTRYSNKRYPLNVLHFKTVPLAHRYHTTQKPINLLKYLIKTYTNAGDIVMDNTMGSGSTGVACAYTNRQFLGMEIEKKYFKISVKRIKKAKVEMIGKYLDKKVKKLAAKGKALRKQFEYNNSKKVA